MDSEDEWVTVAEATKEFGVPRDMLDRVVRAVKPLCRGRRHEKGHLTSLYRRGDLRAALAQYAPRSVRLQRPTVAQEQSDLLAAIASRPGTLAEVLGRAPAMREVKRAAELLADGRVRRDGSGRYEASDEPQTVDTSRMADNGHGVSVGRGRRNGAARGKSRKGQS
jgi:hypothetical protein